MVLEGSSLDLRRLNHVELVRLRKRAYSWLRRHANEDCPSESARADWLRAYLHLGDRHLRAVKKWITEWQLAAEENRPPRMPRQRGRRKSEKSTGVQPRQQKSIHWVPDIFGAQHGRHFAKKACLSAKYVDRFWRLGESIQQWLDQLDDHRRFKALPKASAQEVRVISRSRCAHNLSRLKAYEIFQLMNGDGAAGSVFEDISQCARYLRLWAGTLGRTVNFLKKHTEHTRTIHGVSGRQMAQFGDQMRKIALDLMSALPEVLETPRGPQWLRYCTAWRLVGMAVLQRVGNGVAPGARLFPMDRQFYNPLVGQIA